MASISHQQAAILDACWTIICDEDRPVTAGEIAGATGMDEAGMSARLSHLEVLGFVRRETVPLVIKGDLRVPLTVVAVALPDGRSAFVTGCDPVMLARAAG